MVTVKVKPLKPAKPVATVAEITDWHPSCEPKRHRMARLRLALDGMRVMRAVHR